MASDTASADVIIVTPDLVGPVANGGIGTSCTALAQYLQSLRLNVQILFTLEANFHRAPRSAWESLYKRVPVWTLEPVGHGANAFNPNHAHLIRSYRIYQWLKSRPARIVIFMDWQGEGFYSLMAKRTGLAFQDTWLLVQTHSPSIWHSIFSREPIGHLNQLLTSHLERSSIELADIVVSPSDYMLRWMREFGWSVPSSAVVLPNLIPGDTRVRRTASHRKLDHIVFFGRLEQRKGLEFFCDAIDLLHKAGAALPEVVFLGKFGWVGREHAGSYILGRSLGWSTPIRILNNFDQPAALSWLSAGTKLAVMPSAMDNSPYTIVECLSANIPFAARDVGGVRELIDPADRPRCLVGDNPAELAAHIRDAIDKDPQPIRPAHGRSDVEAKWKSLISGLLSNRPPPSLPEDGRKTPLVSICVVHKDRPDLLNQALQSVFLQTYPNMEVVLVDDGSVLPASLDLLERLRPTFSHRRWKIIRQKNQYLGQARNTAAENAAGEWILFLDDDNVCRLDHVEVLSRAAMASGADIVVSAMDVFLGQDYPGNHTEVVERFLPLGGAAAYGMFANGFGDACALYRRSKFLALGGFTTDWGIGSEDHEFFARAALAGAKFAVVPEPLFWYRRHGASMLHSTPESANAYRALRPYLAAPSADLREAILLAHGLTGTGMRRRSLGPIKALVRQALHMASQAEIIADALSVFERTKALAIMAGSVRQLEACTDPNSADALALARLLYLCCGQEGALGDGLRVGQTPTPSHSEIEAAIRTIEASSGKLIDVEGTGLLERRALLAAAWRLDIDQGQVDALKRSLPAGDPAEPATLVDALLLAVLNPGASPVQGMVQKLLQLVDEEYLDTNTDVAEAVGRGDLPSGAHHYLLYGIAEGRQWPLGDLVLRLAALALDRRPAETPSDEHA
jgi:glycosyltransferase involved in cell wall biosynthesis/GT2 family glycosyltransferase